MVPLRSSVACAGLGSDSVICWPSQQQTSEPRSGRGYNEANSESRSNLKQGSSLYQAPSTSHSWTEPGAKAQPQPLNPRPYSTKAQDEPGARAGVMRLVLHLLWPRMRKRSGRLGGKGAPGSARAAILNTLGTLQPEELAPLVTLFLQPVAPAFESPWGLVEAGPPATDQ